MKALVEVGAAGGLADRIETQRAQIPLDRMQRREVGLRLAQPGGQRHGSILPQDRLGEAGLHQGLAGSGDGGGIGQRSHQHASKNRRRGWERAWWGSPASSGRSAITSASARLAAMGCRKVCPAGGSTGLEEQLRRPLATGWLCRRRAAEASSTAGPEGLSAGAKKPGLSWRFARAARRGSRGRSSASARCPPRASHHVPHREKHRQQNDPNDERAQQLPVAQQPLQVRRLILRHTQ